MNIWVFCFFYLQVQPNGSDSRDSVPLWKEVCIFRYLVMWCQAMPIGMAGNQNPVETEPIADRNAPYFCIIFIIKVT